jgi:DNA-binding response OmpR family regulator
MIGKLSVLVVEPDLHIAHTLVALLSIRGHEVFLTKDPHAAMRDRQHDVILASGLVAGLTENDLARKRPLLIIIDADRDVVAVLDFVAKLIDTPA